MGKTHERIDGRLRAFIESQPIFFTATAPFSGDGTVNLSPKGLVGSFAVLDEQTMAYLDFAGSNAETVSHLRENGRITLMWCAFQGPPNIVRIHGRGEPVFRDDPRFEDLLANFPGIDPASHGLRAIIVVTASLVRDTCGYAVPFLASPPSTPRAASTGTSMPTPPRCEPTTTPPGPRRPRRQHPWHQTEPHKGQFACLRTCTYACSWRNR
ncbi:pyridoxamine 5'-phosphate oxidase family protein [Streptomyces hygroscopicus]|uniref:pyridoxamine 5'-phosphate oxidase family protein n=1 Tax=Streptomyces hygroscopicus TaxID=1912 RepID=UPI001FCAE9EA|nr:pyridoxamine 5'-phosphate oxidase family protein [Streptomyces hygroscopicus]BDH12606.1 hypothetical protein HOK021_37850 [Streptomyces hygroscopicus]